MPLTEVPSAATTARRYLRRGLVVLTVLFVGLGGLAAVSEISGAVIAQGQFVVESHVKRVQHPSGGVVARISAREGAHVLPGDVLVELDGTQLLANLAIVDGRLDEARVRLARLTAERDGRSEMTFAVKLSKRASVPEVQQMMASEARHFALRREARDGQRAQLRARIAQLERQRLGLVEQERAKATEIELMVKEIASLRELWKKKLISLERITASERDAVRLKGELGQLKAGQAQIEGQKSEVELQIIQIDQDLRTEVTRELRDLEAQIAENAERKLALEDDISKLSIRSPQDGLVHQSTVHTVGGVISAGETIMLVVPTEDSLFVDARLAPPDVDQVKVGGVVRLRLSALNYATTPELFGTVEQVSADLITDERTGVSYYKVRVSISSEQRERLSGARIIAGMPVEVFLETPSRTVLSYLIKPISDQLERAFREE